MSVLAIDPAAPWYIKAAAQSVLVLHIGGGSLGMVSGAVALVGRKGGRVHSLAGKTFFASMLTMAAIGAVVSGMMREPSNVIAGVMTFYLVLSSWVAIRRKDRRVGAFEFAGLAAALTVCAAGAFFIMESLNSPTGTVDNNPPQAFYLFLIIGGIAAGSDLKAILQGGVSGVARIARHLWRMCAALGIAAGSFFFGQAQVLPLVIRESLLPTLLVFAPVILLIFWSIRIRFKGWMRPRAQALAAE
jgi:uncharacterized membrane protein